MHRSIASALLLAVVLGAVAAVALTGQSGSGSGVTDATDATNGLALLQARLRRAHQYRTRTGVRPFQACDKHLPTVGEWTARWTLTQRTNGNPLAPRIAMITGVLPPDNVQERDDLKWGSGYAWTALAKAEAANYQLESHALVAMSNRGGARTKAVATFKAFEECAREFYTGVKVALNGLLGTTRGAIMFFQTYRTFIDSSVVQGKNLRDDAHEMGRQFRAPLRGGDREGLYDRQINLQYDVHTGALTTCAVPSDDSTVRNAAPACMTTATPTARTAQHLVTRVLSGGEQHSRFTVRPLPVAPNSYNQIANTVHSVPFGIIRQPIPAATVGTVQNNVAGTTIPVGPRVQYLSFESRECHVMALSETDDQSRFMFTAAMNGCNVYVLKHDTKQPIVMHCNANDLSIVEMHGGNGLAAGEVAKDYTAELVFSRYARAGYRRSRVIRRADYQNGVAAHAQMGNLATLGIRSPPAVNGAPSRAWKFYATYVEEDATNRGHAKPAVDVNGVFQSPFFDRLAHWTPLALHLTDDDGVECPCHERPPTQLEYDNLLAHHSILNDVNNPVAVPTIRNALSKTKLVARAGPDALYNNPTLSSSLRTNVQTTIQNELDGNVWGLKQRLVHDAVRQCVAMFLTAAAAPRVHAMHPFGEIDCTKRVPTVAEYTMAVSVGGDQLAEHVNLPLAHTGTGIDTRLDKRAKLSTLRAALKTRLLLNLPTANAWTDAVKEVHSDLLKCVDLYLQHNSATFKGVDCGRRLPSVGEYLAALGGATDAALLQSLPATKALMAAGRGTSIHQKLQYPALTQQQITAIKAVPQALATHQATHPRAADLAHVHADLTDCFNRFIFDNNL